MATELPMRIVETSGARDWPSSKDSAVFGPPLKNMAAEELGLLLRDHRLLGNQAGAIPNRSGSAPPSMEGSFEALGNLLAQKNVSLDPSLASLTSAIENCESEEQLRADPAYIAYYCSHVNLNPRLPPPLISRENRRLVRHMGGFGNNWRLTSFDDSGGGSLHLSGGSLFTHKEEPEDDKATFQDLDDATGSSIYMPGTNMASLAGRHKSLVDLIQEDFPRTPSPVYQSRSSSHGTKEAFDCDVHVISSNISSMNIGKGSESGPVSADGVETCAIDPSAIGLISNNEPLQTSSTDAVGEAATLQKEDFGRKESKFGNKTSIASLGLSQMSEHNVKIPEGQQPSGRNIPLHCGNAHQNTLLQNPVVQDQVLHQGTNQSQGHMERFSHGHVKSSSGDEQGRMHSVGQSPSVYPTAATYMASNTFYPNLQPQGVYAPQYGLGGYALSSTLLPPYMPAYAPHGAFHVPFSAASGTSFNGRTGGVTGSQGIPNMGDMQHGNKIYGQHNLAYQPPFMDPLHMQYFHHPFGDAYGASTHVGRFPRGGIAGPVNSYMPHNEATVATHMGDPKLQFPGYGNLSIPSMKKGEMLNSNYFGSPPNLGVMTQFPGSPLASPVVPSSPVGGIGPVGRRSEVRFSPGSTGNGGMYSGWQGQRGVNNFDDLKRNSFLEELKSNSSRKFELSDIAGRVVEFSVDQHGSRFIQQKLETSSFEEKEAVFKEVLPHASRLMTDVFGNYVIQKFFEHGSPEQRKELANQLAGQMVPLSLQMYGCRVIQKALEVIELDQKTRLVHELDGHVMRCVRDQNGNHVIQKCIESVPTKRIAFIISAFRGQVATLSTHPYGCRVIQRVLEHCSDELQSQCIVDEILESAYLLAQDQYGNYVTQHVLERGRSEERSQIISKLTGKIVQMSQHKYASNVIEKCLEHGDAAERALMIEEIIGQSEENDNLLAMMKDQFANYVVQKILEVCNDKHREILLNRINTHLHALKKYTYGKHIVARFEQLVGEESQTAEPTTS